MSVTIAALLLFAAPQEPSAVPGSNRGPQDETLLELTTLRLANGEQGETPHFNTDYVVSSLNRWEFWFEHERDVLFRGEPDFPARAVNEHGSYGSEDWAVERQDLLLTSMPLLIDALHSDVPAIREAAALSLGRIGYPAADTFLQRTTKDSVESVRQAAYMGLGLMASEQGTEFLIDTFEESDDYGTRAFAALGLGLSGRVEGGTVLKAYLNKVYYNESWKAQEDLLMASMMAAGVHGSNDFTPLLMNLLKAMENQASTTRLRTTAIAALGAIGDRRARPTLEEALNAQEHGVPEAAAQALGRLGDKGAVGQLATMVRESNNVRLRSLSMLAIGRLGGRQAEAVLKELRPVKGDEENLYASWAIAAGMSGHDGAYPALVATLLHGTDDRKHSENDSPRRDEEELRGAAAVALGLYGAPGGKSQIEKVLEMKNVRPTFRGYMATGLGLLGTDAADELLLKLAKQEKLTPAERRGIATGLGLAKSEKTSVALVKILLEDEDDGVRWAASRALATSRSTAALRLLEEGLRTELGEPNQRVQAAHLVLGLGFLGDTHNGATISSMLAGMDYRQEHRLIGALSHY
ncbi:MAG: HEAT repeat domain-containing protein [Planctomycetes bacterium]|nr:HEAT repeat domain-containing protein [Planctomycetota bacterium]MCP4771132.1 HEAT repeat domain-containing protein [Planctomycetota bacterium]MCP4862141.1 HEAT repeat domain-containing protein [Planctomycetota bacterium]